MAFAVLPAFLKQELGVSHGTIGLVEGLAIGSSFFAKVLSGILSDVWVRRKPLILIGSVVSVVTKGMFALGTGMGFIAFTRFLDRFFKGVRSAPTDAFLADIANMRWSHTFGQRQALYTLGAVFGASAAMGVLLVMEDGFRLVFFLSMIPAMIALLLLVTRVHEPVVHRSKDHRWHIKHFKMLPGKFWLMLVVTSVLMISRFSETFLSLRAIEMGVGVGYIPFIIIIMDLAHAGFAFGNGKLNRFLPKQHILILATFILVVAHGLLYFSDTPLDLFVGVFVNGISLGLTQGIIRAQIAQMTPTSMYGTVFSLFYLVSGLSVLWGNSLAGICADTYGLPSIFLVGALFALLALVLLCFSLESVKTPLPVSKIRS